MKIRIKLYSFENVSLRVVHEGLDDSNIDSDQYFGSQHILHCINVTRGDVVNGFGS